MQAIIYDISPFDASVGTIIKFSWNGNQFFKNRCVIRENESNTIVYDNTIKHLSRSIILTWQKPHCKMVKNTMLISQYLTKKIKNLICNLLAKVFYV